MIRRPPRSTHCISSAASDVYKRQTQEGVVVAVGDDESIKVKAKDRVLYDKYAGSTIKVDGEEQLIVKMSDILAVIQ